VPLSGHRPVIAVVSNDRETLRGIDAYFRRADLVSHGTADIVNAVSHAPETIAALVVFADEFQGSSVADLFIELRRERPAVLLVVVTATPSLFRNLPSLNGRRPAVTISGPVSPWGLLGVIRDAVDAAAGTTRT
jgi:hypothetical protein